MRRAAVVATVFTASFAAVFGAIFSASCTTLAPLHATDGRIITEAQTDHRLLRSRSVELHTTRYTVHETFPVLDAGIPSAPVINTRVEEAIRAAERDFLQAAAQAAQLELHAPWEFVVTWTLSEFTPQRISALLEIYAYTGGAHGSTTLVPINVAIPSGTEILLSDLWKTSQGGVAAEPTTHAEPKTHAKPNARAESDWAGWNEWLRALSETARPLLAAELKRTSGASPDTDWLEEGTLPAAANFRIFTLKGDTLIFRFAQYQVAPYSSGMPKITIPLEAVRQLARSRKTGAQQ